MASSTRINERTQLQGWNGGRLARSGPAGACDDTGELRFDDTAATSAALERAAGAICARWKPTILLLLTAGARRRSELDRCLPATVSPKVLTDQLRGLEADGLVVRIDRRALRHAGQRHVTYSLTPAGEELSGVVQALARWGTAHWVGDLRMSGHHAVLRGDRPVQPTALDVADRRTG